jgi:hypothetical protein
MDAEKKPPMLDPAWTPAAGYSHAANLLAIIKASDTKVPKKHRR